MKILQSAIDKIGELFKRPKTYLKFLNEEEFEELMDLMMSWYSRGDTLEVILKDKKNNKSFASLLLKLKRKTLEKLPPKLYRGVHWKNKKDMDKFIKQLENNKFPTLKDEGYASWTTSKKIAKSFLPNGLHGSGHGSKYGILLEINPRDFKSDIVFSTMPLFKNQEEINIFLKLILEKYHNKNINVLKKKKPNLSDIHINTYFIQGNLYSVEEKEYVVKNPTKNIDKIKYTEEKKD